MTVLKFNVTPLSLLKRGHCPPKLNTIVFSEGGERGEFKVVKSRSFLLAAGILWW